MTAEEKEAPNRNLIFPFLPGRWSSYLCATWCSMMHCHWHWSPKFPTIYLPAKLSQQARFPDLRNSFF